MKLSLNWLSDFVDFSEKNPHKIAEALTLSVAEVEEVEEQGALLKNCVVGKVVKIEKHPDADKLSLCDVKTDRGVVRVVCGGTNLREGMCVAFAHVGACIKTEDGELFELKKVKIRGEESSGMICASVELELADRFPATSEQGDRPVIDLGDSDEGVGTPLKDYLGLDDVIFHIDNHAITHRADLFSQVGFARECVALGLGKWKKNPEIKNMKSGSGSGLFKFINDAPKKMPRYCACFLEIDGIGETPDWMKKKLEAVGWRSLNLPIDITNYVATEIGVPLHSFDVDDIKGDVHMREAKKGEKIVTLDEAERELPAGALVLSDDEGIFDLLGIMGGLRSSTKESTRRIYLHSASLDSVSIRRTILATGHRTDAATIYEKGVPHIVTEQGFYRALELFLELVPGAKLVSEIESCGDNGKPEAIELPIEKVSQRLGQEISKKEAVNALGGLDFDVKSKKSVLSVTPPLHRLNDIKQPADLIEEIARIIGFSVFEEEIPEADVTLPARDDRLNVMRDVLKEVGFYETVQFAFAGEGLLKKAGNQTRKLREIENPLGGDIKYMRPSLIPRLLDYASENIRLVDEELKIFEVGHVFEGEGEHQSFALIISSVSDGGVRNTPFLRLKSVIKEICEAVGLEVGFKNDKKPASSAHPGRAVKVIISGKDVGTLTELHPAIGKNFDLAGRTAVCEINLEEVLSESSAEKIYEELPEFPSITYDSTVTVGDEVEATSLISKAGKSHEFLQNVALVDLFEKDGKRQLTFRCTYNAGDRTLTEEEVKPIHEKVEAGLGQTS